jgi:hypothetical protein
MIPGRFRLATTEGLLRLQETDSSIGLNIRTLICVWASMNRVLAALTILAGFAAAQNSPTPPLLIRNVTVIDCAGHVPHSGMSVLVSDGRIAAITTSSKTKTPANAEVLEGDGKFLIPGLWNMHVHLGAYEGGKRALAAYLAEGITGVRDMGSPLDDILRLRSEVDHGAMGGPHLIVAGPIVQGPLPFQMPAFISVKDVTAARQVVKLLKNRGVDFIKVQDAIPHDIHLALAEEARSEHIPFAGHVPPTVLPEEASDLGQRSIEHRPLLGRTRRIFQPRIRTARR